jgi:hypothetical protein
MCKYTKQIVVVLLCGLLLGITGCDPEMSTNPILPGQISVLNITFQPNPVYEGYNDRYRFTVFIDEVNGVGARIDSIKVEYIGEDGDVQKTENFDQIDITYRLFGTSRIEAFGRLMASVQIEDCSFCERQNWLVRADDDNGNHVEYSASVELINR